MFMMNYWFDLQARIFLQLYFLPYILIGKINSPSTICKSK
jgi:hypothetical protein